MEFWEFEISFFDSYIIIGMITIVFLLANVIRRKVSFIRKSLLPTAVIGGIIMLIIKSLGLLDAFIDVEEANGFLESITYHTLALGFIALALKSTTKEKNKEKQKDIIRTGLITVNTYVIQGIVGVLITILLASSFMKSLLPATGFLLPMGFGQGPGQALNFGSVFESEYGLIGGPSFGLSIAAIGFLVACIIGVIHINIEQKKGRLKILNEKPKFITTEIIASPNEIPLTESVDRFTIQMALIAIVYFITFLFMLFIEQLPLGNFGVKTLKPLIWGFNFLIGTLFAILLKQIFYKFRKSNLMTRDYPNNYLLNRISGFMFDIMIIAGITAIKIDVVKSLIIPLILIVTAGTVVTYLYVRYATYKLFPKYKDQSFLSLFGMLTGTASTGIILLREVDPKFETPAANNLVYQSFYAIIFGFPLFLLLGFAPQSMNYALISLGIVVFMFIVFNYILFTKLNKKVNKTNKH